MKPKQHPFYIARPDTNLNLCISLQVWQYLELSVQNISISEPSPFCQERCSFILITVKKANFLA